MRLTEARSAGVFAALIAIGLAGAGAATAQTPPPGVAYSAGFVPGNRTVFDLGLGSEVVGEAPKSVKLLKGNLEVVLKNGTKMLKASSATEFLITLPEFLPQDFTVEFSVVPKLSGNPQDLSFEGTRTINQDVASAHILWQAGSHLAVIGGATDNYETPMPEDFKTTLPGVLTKVGASFEGNTVKLYTNGRRLFTLDRKFARGRVFRVFLGGADDPAEGVVYLAGLRIASNSPPVTGFSNAPAGFSAGSRVLYDLNTPPPPQPPPGQPPPPPKPPWIRVIKGAWTPVQKDGRSMRKVAKPTELVVTLAEKLPQDFTVEVELVPKESGGPPPDLTLEGTSVIDQGPASAHLLWQANSAVSVIGGAGAGENYESPMPEDFKVTLPGAPTQVALSVQGNTIKLYTNGQRLYTLTRSFVRGRVLRVSLGAENDTDQAVYLAGLRIATNAPPPPTP